MLLNDRYSVSCVYEKNFSKFDTYLCADGKNAARELAKFFPK